MKLLGTIARDVAALLDVRGGAHRPLAPMDRAPVRPVQRLPHLVDGFERGRAEVDSLGRSPAGAVQREVARLRQDGFEPARKIPVELNGHGRALGPAVSGAHRAVTPSAGNGFLASVLDLKKVS